MMKNSKHEIPNVPIEQQSPLVLDLLKIIEKQSTLLGEQSEERQKLRDEIAQLKNHKGKPKIPPSRLEKGKEKKKRTSKGKRAGSKKRSKTVNLEIHDTEIVDPVDIPEGSKFMEYQDFFVQDLLIRANNTRYRRGRWETPDGNYIIGELPSSVDGHFGSTLKSFILYQHNQCHVTQPLIFESLREWEVDISSGQVNGILIEKKEAFHKEKDDLLPTALESSSYVQTDDTGARHAGKNGYCTHIGNDFFAWYSSTNSKSRINFLTLLCAGSVNYVLNEEALDYMAGHKFPKMHLPLISTSLNHTFENQVTWEEHLKSLGIEAQRHIQIATEGALMGNLLSRGLPKDLVIVSDDAGQFKILNHSLCWVHAERTINKIIPYSEKNRQALKAIRDQIWKLYDDLKAYKKAPAPALKRELEKRFDTIFTTKTCFVTLNSALERLHNNKEELLLVLERPEIPLHNNLSETDIREYVTRRKISGGTRSDLGRQARDTFTSLKKTTRKLGISFWGYLKDRVSKTNQIPGLAQIMAQQMMASN